MPTKLPLLGGGERELREGDRVRWSDGVEDNIVEYFNLSESFRTTSGRSFHPRQGTAGPTIVLILGPAEETHEDGTVTRLCTLPVTMPAEAWETHETVGVGHQAVSGFWLDPYGHVRKSMGVSHADFGYLQLREKPAPTPTYAERLIEAVRAGTFLLPIESGPVRSMKRIPNDDWYWNTASDAAFEIDFDVHGKPPKWQPGDPTEIDLQPIRDALKERA